MRLMRNSQSSRCARAAFIFPSHASIPGPISSPTSKSSSNAYPFRLFPARLQRPRRACSRAPTLSRYPVHFCDRHHGRRSRHRNSQERRHGLRPQDCGSSRLVPAVHRALREAEAGPNASKLPSNSANPMNNSAPSRSISKTFARRNDAHRPRSSRRTRPGPHRLQTRPLLARQPAAQGFNPLF